MRRRRYGRASRASPYPNLYIGVAAVLLGLLVFVGLITWLFADFMDVTPLYSIMVIQAIAGVGFLAVGLQKMSEDKAEAESKTKYLISRICGVCNRELGHVDGKIRFFHTDPRVQDPTQYFHEACYREALRSQGRRCPNCSTPLYNPLSTEFLVPVFKGEGGLLFCSQKCSTTYRPLTGLAVAPPTDVSCPYCKTVFSSSLTTCPNCGGTRTRVNLDLTRLSPLDFETKIAELLTRMGYVSVVRVGGSGDRAALRARGADRQHDPVVVLQVFLEHLPVAFVDSHAHLPNRPLNYGR